MRTECPGKAEVAKAPRTQDIDRLLRLEAVMDMVGLGRTMIYRLIRRGDFPRPYKPGGFASRWSEREVVEWKERQRAA